MALVLTGCDESIESGVTETDTPEPVVGTTRFTTFSEFSAAASSFMTIDFDDRQTGAILSGNEYPDVRIISRNISVINPTDFSPNLIVGEANVNSAPNGISASLLYASSGTILSDNLDDDFQFMFSAGKSSAGVWIGNIGANDNDVLTPTAVRFFDSSGNVISEFGITQASEGLVGSGASNRIFRGIRSETPIASFSILNAASDNDAILIDDLVFEAK